MMSADAPITDQVIDVVAQAKGVPHGGDRRAGERYPYTASVGIVLIAATGERYPPMVVQARNLSAFGISVVSRLMIHPGSGGAVQLVKSDGTAALVGVAVRYCHYLGHRQHATGLEFTRLPPGLKAEEFLDARGRMPLFDPDLDPRDRQELPVEPQVPVD
jgi:hypothetical protein